MTVRLTHWWRPWRRAALVAIIAALPSLPLAAASDPPPAPAKPQTLESAVRTAAVKNAVVVAAPRARAARRADQSGSARQSTGFFRSKPGAVALVVMAVGTGYALYSASHDKINSPGKK